MDSELTAELAQLKGIIVIKQIEFIFGVHLNSRELYPIFVNSRGIPINVSDNKLHTHSNPKKLLKVRFGMRCD